MRTTRLSSVYPPITKRWSHSAPHTNDKTLLVIHSPQLAKHFTREMDRLWDSAELGITPRIRQQLVGSVPNAFVG